MSSSVIEPLFHDAAGWDLFDANVRVGPSGIYGELALETEALLEEMDRFAIRNALASHWTAEEYDAEEGNRALERDLHPRVTPAWTALPAQPSVDKLAARRPLAVRLSPGVNQHNFSLTFWCAGPLLEYLEEHSVVTLVSRSDVDWQRLYEVMEKFPRLVLILLDVGYRSDRYLFPLLERFSHLHFDSATYLAHRQLEAFVDQHGFDRIVFGSRLPLYTPASALGVLASARIPDDARRAIAGGNLRRLLRACRNHTAEAM